MSVESPLISPEIVERDAELLLSDGVRLLARLWHPNGDGPWPALLMRQPYGRRLASTVTLAHPCWWARRGYLVVVQDVRGQGDSEGSFGGFAQEADDTAQTHAWVRSLPECNGRIGCYGFSYQGMTQLLAPADAPPPDCLAPAMAGLDERRHWSSEGNAHWWHLNLGWGLQLAAQQARRRRDCSAWETIRRALEDGSYLRDGPELLKRHDPDGMACRWLAQDPADDTVWRRHVPPASWLRQPLLLLGGWWDPHLLGILDLFKRSEDAGGAPELHIGPASHLDWWPQAQTLLLRFFDQHLKHGQPGPRQLQFWDLGLRQWRLPPQPSPLRWSLQGEGLACLDPSSGRLNPEQAGAGEERIVHDPWRPVPAIGGHLSPSAGPADRQSLDERADVATFTTAPLQASVELSGQPQLLIRAGADQPGFDLCVVLSRLPQGSAAVEQLSSGVLRILGGAAERVTERRVLLQPLLATCSAGDRLRLSIAAAAWPAVGVNPGTPDHPCGAPSANHRVVTMTLELAGSLLSLNPFNSGRLSLD